MFSSRNIHFAILGIILGASGGYVFAFYQAESALAKTKPAAPTVIGQQSDLPSNHPDVSSSDAQMIAMLKQNAEEHPQDVEAQTRYANVLFKLGRLQEAMSGYDKVLQLQPDNLDIRSLRGAVLWNMGKPDEARKEMQIALKKDPNHIPSLYGMFLLAIDQHDVSGATQLLAKIEKIDPTYEGLGTLRDRLEEERRNTAKK